MGELLADLRELTRLDLTHGVRLRPLALEEFGRDLAARFRPATVARDVTIDVDVRAEPVTTDVRLLETIASNLLSNAIQPTPSGGHVQVQVRKRRGELVLAVRDTGVGIAPEHQERIFERLYRVDDTRDRATGGSGLGLAIASRAAHSLGGRIELQSTVDHGSEFQLILPLDRENGHREDDGFTGRANAQPIKTDVATDRESDPGQDEQRA